ncbi:YesL family protein [Lacticaseibacillus mingshuiensis]|uniref:DUF624 domain-containing protein n=1 Tax=Lacticaseibacillus mingshuiensis TaxID=2799574 RepID=A0ABW4CKJ8_9LACO|nr:YesL family protein [Lacticaseibacillus mingshuiensis]
MKFNPNSSFFRAMGTLVSFVAVNFVFIITCLPVFTIGAGLAAMQRTMMQYIDQSGLSLTRSYLKNFKSSFKLGTTTWLTVLALAAVFIFNVNFWRGLDDWFATPVMVLMIIATGVLLLICQVLFPLVGTFANTYKQTFKNAALLVLPELPKVLLLAVIDVLAALLFIFTSFGRVTFVLFGFAFWLYLKAFVDKKLLADYSDQV